MNFQYITSKEHSRTPWNLLEHYGTFFDILFLGMQELAGTFWQLAQPHLCLFLAYFK